VRTGALSKKPTASAMQRITAGPKHGRSKAWRAVGPAPAREEAPAVFKGDVGRPSVCRCQRYSGDDFRALEAGLDPQRPRLTRASVRKHMAGTFTDHQGTMNWPFTLDRPRAGSGRDSVDQHAAPKSMISRPVRRATSAPITSGYRAAHGESGVRRVERWPGSDRKAGSGWVATALRLADRRR
jgi:hypothetical protein